LVNDQGGMLPLLDAISIFGSSLVKGPNSTTVIIPLLASGRWQLASFGDSKTALLYLAGFGRLPVVREFTVAPGASIEIDLR